MASMTLLQLNPTDTLHFTKAAGSTPVSRTLKLTNTSNGNVAFKVKTTAPRSYLVRPSASTLRPGDSQDVQIILQAQGADTQVNTHRFLVQAVPVDDPAPLSREEWAKFGTDAIHQHRLNVVVQDEGEEAQARPADGRPSSGVGGKASEAGGPSELESKYDELVQYTLKLEKEKKRLELEIAGLQKSQPASSGGDVSKLTLILAVIVAFVAAYAAKALAPPVAAGSAVVGGAPTDAGVVGSVDLDGIASASRVAHDR